MNKSSMVVASAVLIGCLLVGEMVVKHAPRKTVVTRSEPERVTPHTQPATRPAAPPADAPQVVASNPTPPAEPPAPRVAATAPVARAQAVRPPDVNPAGTEPVVPAEVARTALSYVGADPEAEEVWFAAINDPSLSAHARQDLIEDLNEDGFADPKNVTQDDLPLIVSRLALIEEVAPDAMDDVNADAFAEAYKDLANMYQKLTNQ